MKNNKLKTVCPRENRQKNLKSNVWPNSRESVSCCLLQLHAMYNISSKISMVVTFDQEAMLGKFENFCLMW